MHTVIRILIVVVCILLGLAVLAFIGLQVTPRPFGPYPGAAPALKTVPLPANLPAPVERYYKTTIGDQVPVVDTAVISIRGTMRLFHLTLPMRMRVVHQAGQGFYRILQPTFFGFPVATWLDTYWEGNAHVDMPPGIPDNHPKMKQASNLALWVETIILSSVLVTDQRVRWEPIDETHARLVVPLGDQTDSITVTFDPQTGLPASMDALRWAGPEDVTQKVWRANQVKWERVQGMLLPTVGSAQWGEDQPWLVMRTDEILYNVDIMPFVEQYRR